MLAGKWQPASSTSSMDWQARVDLVTSVVLAQWSHMRTCQCRECRMSANLEELESTRSAEAQSEDLDSVTKAEVVTLVNRYCFGYQHKIAIKDFEALIKAARKNR
jgi:hypothetical protein